MEGSHLSLLQLTFDQRYFRLETVFFLFGEKFLVQDTLSSRARLASSYIIQPLGRVRARAKVSCIQSFIMG